LVKKICSSNPSKIGGLINLIAMNKILQLCSPKRIFTKMIAQK
jgi:hypothetical protein